MQKDDTLITASSVTPEPDEGCVATCYYVGWNWDHDHGGCSTQTETQDTVDEASAMVVAC